jgi:hypothetical protein
MERVVQLYIEGERLELFDDEDISINSSIQNVQDISKIFTDFTQSFSVPASPSNNVIMRHFYNSEVILYENEFLNPATRRNATIEIDGTFFRRGKVQLEKALIENGEPYSYTLTFYGDLISLKDTFGDVMLSELDYTSLNFAYTYTQIKNRIEDGATDYDVRYPLIASSRYWQYNNSTTPDENIDTTQGAIVWTELFPAVKVKAIFDIIQSHFGVTFQGAFLDDPRFTNAFTLFKNTTEYGYISPPIDIEFVDITSAGVVVAPPFPYTYENADSSNDAEIVFDDTDNSIALEYVTYDEDVGFGVQTLDIGIHVVLGTFSNVTPNNVTYYVDVYRQGQFYATIEATGGGDQTLNLFTETNDNNTSLNSQVSFKVRSDSPISMDVLLRYYFQSPYGVIGFVHSIDCTSISTSQEVDLSTQTPKIKVSDYFNNILKLFNLTAYGIEADVYQLETIEEWYNKGGIFDITEYTDLASIDVKRIQLFKTIAFEYAQSKSITNRAFANTFYREYGNLSSIFDYEAGEYKIDVVFENMLFSKFTDTNLQVAYALDEDLKPYVPAPVNLYKYDNQDVSFYLTDNDTNTDEITSYVVFGQDMVDMGTNYSLNWGSENSSLLDVQILNGLYNTYYKAYIENLYDPKNREITIKTRLPLSILTDLELNDRVIIRDKRYIINNIKSSLTSGEATMVLINDFRKMIADAVPPLVPPIKPNPDAQCLQVFIPFIKSATSCTITECTSPSVSGVTITPSTITEEQYVEVCIPAYTNADTLITTEIDERISTENSLEFVLDESDGSRTIVLCVVYDLADGTQVANQIFIEQGFTNDQINEEA